MPKKLTGNQGHGSSDVPAKSLQRHLDFFTTQHLKVGAALAVWTKEDQWLRKLL